MSAAQLSSSLSTPFGAVAALELVCAALAVALVLAGAAWWRQRRVLRGTRDEASHLRGEADAQRRQQATLQAVVEASGLVAFRCGASFDSPVLQIDPAIEHLSGQPAQAFTQQGRCLLDIVHPDDRAQLQARLGQLAAGAAPSALEFRIQHSSGASRWVSATCTLHHGDGIAWMAGTLLDVDRHQTATHHAQQREALYASLITGIPGAAYRCTADDNWTVLFISEAVQQLTGWSQADYMASPALLRELVHLDDHARVTEEVQAAIDANRPYTLEYRAMHRDGHMFWAWGQGKAGRDEAGRVVWLEGVVVDISERKAMELALRDAKDRAEEAASAKTAFLANMGHEVRTPLNAIIGFSEIVLRNELDTLQRQYVFKVRQAATALLRLMNDILDMAKLERSQLQCASGDFSLRDLAQEALAAQRAAAEQKGLALRLDTEPGLSDAFQGDAARLRQVLDKLLDNAVKFTEGGTVRVQLARQQGQVLLAVHDTGIGIAPQDQARVFEAFAQVDASASRRFGGTGLGVTLARQLVERMGGSLTLQSAPGQGSVFRVLVPLADAAAPQPERPADHLTDRAADSTPPAPHHDAPLPAGLQALLDAPELDDLPWHDSLRATVLALRNGDQGDTDLPALLQRLRGRGLTQHAAQVEQALARFDLDRAAELLETIPSRL